MSTQIARSLLLTAMCALTAAPGYAADSPSETWRHARKGTSWSREDVLTPLCTQNKLDKMLRSNVLAIFGEPDMSFEHAAMGSGRSSRADVYQLSDKNNSDFEVTYIDDRVSSNVKAGACIFKVYLGPAASGAKTLTSDKLKQLLFNQYTPQRLISMTIGELKAILGPPDYQDENVAPNFPTPLRSSSYYWRTSPDGRKYFSVYTSGRFDQPLDKRGLSMLTSVTLSQDCPVKPPAPHK